MLAVIKHDIVQYILLRLMACLIIPPLHALLFQTAEKTFRNRIMPQGQAARSQQLPLRPMLPVN